ncbi:TPA: acyltransferase, partial [Enterococcus faecium]|nr:acyltransferase [Enterococcus faecium]
MRKISGFTLLKLICAFQVMFGHLLSYFHMNAFTVGNVDIVWWILSPFQGVPIFFALSSFFIWNSLSNRQQSLMEYAKKRFIRIYPELWIVVVFSIISITVLYGIKKHVFSFITWVVCQISIFQFWTPDFLRGYGMGCPNGPLWTITIFIQF